MNGDITYADIVRRCTELQAKGGRTFVKYTCAGCGTRRTYLRADRFPRRATCAACGARTDIERTGGGFLLAIPTPTIEAACAVREQIVTGARADGVDAQVDVVNIARRGRTLARAVAAMTGEVSR